MVEFFILVAAGLFFFVLRPIWEIGSDIHEMKKRGIRDTLVMSEDEEIKMMDDFSDADSRAECLKEIKEELDYVFDGKRYPWMDKAMYRVKYIRYYSEWYLLSLFQYICFVLYAAKKYGKYSRAIAEGTRRSCIVQDLSQEESDLVLKKMAVTAERFVMEAHPLETKEATMLTWENGDGSFSIKPRLGDGIGNAKRLTL